MKSKPILLVDDDIDDRELIQNALSEIGVQNEIKCFNDGKAALHYLKHSEERTFIIFSDVNMPGVDGFSFKQEINKDDQLRKQSIPFVFLSTSATNREVEKAYDMMAQGYFRKPSNMAELKDILQTVTHYWGTAKHPKSSGAN